MKRTYEEIRDAVVKCLLRLRKEGKDIQKGYFGDANVQLSVCNHSDTEYSVNYCCYSSMWNFIILKDELKLSPGGEGFSHTSKK